MPVEHFVGKPLQEKFPHIDRWWLIYVALVSGGVVARFAGLMPDVTGRILTGLVVGDGSELLHQIIAAAGDLAAKWASPVR